MGQRRYFDEDEPCLGDMAINRYIDGKEGRMIWWPKNALGTSLIHEKTQIKDQSITFTEIIGFIINNLKFQCETQSEQELTNIVVGRPVYYNDKDQKLDNQRLGHHAAIAVEKGKIALTKSDLAAIKINDITPHIDVSLTKEDLDNSIHEDVDRIVTTLKDTLRNAQISATDISAIFMTGGASLVPLVRSKILSLLPEARLIDGDKFGSVATGLTLLSAQRFC